MSDQTSGFSAVQQLFEQGELLRDIAAKDMPGVIAEFLDALVARGRVEPEARPMIERALLDREAISTTAIGHEVAVPHARPAGLTEPIFAFGRLTASRDLGAPDGVPTRFVFLLIFPEQHRDEDIELLVGIARVMADESFRDQARDIHGRAELLELLDQAGKRRALQDADRDLLGLEYSGRFAGGLLTDLKRRLPRYVSDFTDGLTVKTLGSVLFLYFACLSSTVAFGGLMADATNGAIGVTHMIVATAVGGIIYALTSGQPLTLIGGTGPLFVFTAMLYGLCKSRGLPFLPVYAWVGLWTGLFTVLLTLFDGSALIRWCTRFTDEIFAALISAIFITEAIRKIGAVLTEEGIEHDTQLLSFNLALGTFWLATSLKELRRSRYLRTWLREFIADFGSIIAIVSMTLIGLWLHKVEIKTLPVPESLPSIAGLFRPADLLAVPMSVRLGAILPALLGTVLLFLDQNITTRLVNKSDNRLEKGPGYHLDLLIVGLLTVVLSFFGLPWLVAATVRSLNHLHSLASVEAFKDASGEVHERIGGVIETRLSAVGIHLLIFASLLLLPWLRMVPMPVLFGLFLYMGVASMTGNQFVDRLKLWFMEPKLYPTSHYSRVVALGRIHLFTGLQLIGLFVLWLIKVSPANMLFPIAIALLVPFRFALSRIFTEDELAALDSAEEPEEEIYRESD